MILPAFEFFSNTFTSSKPNYSSINSTSNKVVTTSINQSTSEVTEELMLSFSSRGYASTERVPPAKVHSDPIPASLKRNSSTRKTNSMPIGARSHSSFSSPTGVVSPLFSSLREERRPVSLFAFDNYIRDMDESDDSDHNCDKNTKHRTTHDVAETKPKNSNSENNNKSKKNNRSTYHEYERHTNIVDEADADTDDEDDEDADSDEYDSFADNGAAISSPIFHIRTKTNSINNRDAWQSAKNTPSPDGIKLKSCHIFREHERDKLDFGTSNNNTTTTTIAINTVTSDDNNNNNNDEKSNNNMNATSNNVIRLNRNASLSTSSSPVFPINCWHLPWNQHKVQMCRYCHRPLPPERVNNANASITLATVNKTPRAITSPVRTSNNNVTTEGENATLVKLVDEDLIAFVASENDIHDVLDDTFDYDDDDSDDEEFYRSGMFSSSNAGYCHCKFAPAPSPNQHDESMTKLPENVSNSNISQSFNNRTGKKKNLTPSRPPSPVLYVVETRHSHSRQLPGTVNLHSFSSSSSRSTSSSSSSSSSSPLQEQSVTRAQQHNEKQEHPLLPSEMSASLPQSAPAHHAEHVHKRTTTESTIEASTTQKKHHKSKLHHAAVRLSLVLPLTNSLLHKKTRIVHDNNGSSPVNTSKENAKTDITQEHCPPTSFASSHSPPLQRQGEKQLDKNRAIEKSENDKYNNSNVNNNNSNNKNKSSLSTSKKGSSTVSSWVKEQRERLSSLNDSKSPPTSSKLQANKVK